MAQLSLMIVKSFKFDAVLLTPFFLGETAGIALLYEIQPLLVSDCMNYLIHHGTPPLE